MDSLLQDLFGLGGLTAVVTGGTSGLGAAAAEGLALAGAEVILVGRDAERGAAVVQRIRAAGGTAELQLADVGLAADITELERVVRARHPVVDILVNAAGICPEADAATMAVEDWERVFAVNVTGTFLMCQAFGRAMLERGSGAIVNFASTDALVGVPRLVAYCASKGAVVQMTRALAVEWIKQGVRVNCLAPTEFATPMVGGMLEREEYREWVAQAIPVGRVGQPSELVGALLLLVAPSSAMVVGHTLVVDGGRTVS